MSAYHDYTKIGKFMVVAKILDKNIDYDHIKNMHNEENVNKVDNCIAHEDGKEDKALPAVCVPTKVDNGSVHEDWEENPAVPDVSVPTTTSAVFIASKSNGRVVNVAIPIHDGKARIESSPEIVVIDSSDDEEEGEAENAHTVSSP